MTGWAQVHGSTLATPTNLPLSLDEDQIGGEIELQAGPDRVFRFGRWQVLYHVVLHGMQHHAEIAALLTDQGLSPGDIDFIFYALGR